MKVAVIGAGVVGASVAFRLSQQEGREVTIIDRAKPGSGTTSTSFAWLNANQKTPLEYFELNYAGLKEHFRLGAELGEASWLHPGGNLVWSEDENDLAELGRRVDRLRSWGYAAEWWSASQVNELLEPRVAFPATDTPVAYFPEEAWIDAPQLARTLVELARREGTELRFGTAVESIETRGAHIAAIRLSGGERIPVDAVVNAAGPAADQVASLLGRSLPLAPRRGLLVRLAVEGDPLGRIMHTRNADLRPDEPGYLLVHHNSIDQKLEEDASSIESLHGELLRRSHKVLPTLSGAEVVETRVGVRPIPIDGLSCVGAVSALPGYYEAVTHSGVTLGPLLGRLLAKEILTGEVDSLMTPYRPDRFVRD